MSITVDTNILVRFIVHDDVQQTRVAEKALRQATQVVVTLPCLCELIWVLGRTYRYTREDIAKTVDVLLSVSKIRLDREAVLYGVAIMRAGGDFADGVIAYEGRQLGGQTFLSFDQKAVSRVRAQGDQAQLLS